MLLLLMVSPMRDHPTHFLPSKFFLLSSKPRQLEICAVAEGLKMADCKLQLTSQTFMGRDEPPSDSPSYPNTFFKKLE